MKKKTLLKILAGVVLVIAAGLFAFNWYWEETSHLYAQWGKGDRKLFLEIPQETVKAKDCDGFRKWISGFYERGELNPGLIEEPDCPWADVEPVGHFTVNGVMFNIPREYMWQNRTYPDGEMEALYLMFKYPEMTKGEPYADDTVTVTIKKGGKTRVCDKNSECLDVARMVYGVRTNIDKVSKDGKFLIEGMEAPKQPEFIEELGLTKFKVGKPNGDYFYVEGDLLMPSYWFWCRGICESDFMYNDNKIEIHYTFKKNFLKEHREVRKKIIEKLDSFIADSGNNGKEKRQ